MTDPRTLRLTAALQAAGLDAIALNPSPTLTYLTGLRFHLMERPVVLLYAPPAKPALILAELEKLKVAQSRLEVNAFTYGDNPAEWGLAFQRACDSLQLDEMKVGVEPNYLRVLELRYLEDAAPGVQFVSAEKVVSALRMQKDADEVAAMRQAVKIAQEGLLNTLKLFKVGMSEHELATELTLQLLRAGSDSEMPFAPIVSGGPNSANPHASPSERLIQLGDMLVIDWGASFHGYISDLTRTFAIGAVSPKMREIARVTMEANAAGRAAGRPGVAAGAVDAAARAVIDAAGYGQYFTHRVGHGIGMEGHEPPYMYGENELVLEAGMTYTVEPGIYIPGEGGVRVEDDMVVTADGCETLSDLPRELLTLG